MRRVVGAALVFALLGACRGAEPAPSARAGWPQELIIGVAGDSDGDAPLDNHAPIAARLGRATGLPVKFYTSTNYSVIVEALRARRIHALQLGVFSYLLAAEHANAEALAVFVNTFADPAIHDPALVNGYYSIIVTKKGSGVRSLADLKGKTFNFGDPASTSGHLVPKTEMIRAGLTPGTDVKTRFAGDHAAAMVSLWNGHADAAAVSESNLRNIVESGLVKYCGFPLHEIRRPRTVEALREVYERCPAGVLVPIHYSFPIPGTPFAVRADLPADLKNAIRETLLGTADDAEFIRTAKRWYADPSTGMGLSKLDAYYNPLREMAKLLDLDLRTVQ